MTERRLTGRATAVNRPHYRRMRTAIDCLYGRRVEMSSLTFNLLRIHNQIVRHLSNAARAPVQCEFITAEGNGSFRSRCQLKLGRVKLGHAPFVKLQMGME